MLRIGTVELGVIAVVAIVVLVLNRCGYLSMRWCLAVLGCATVGALLTPADAFSMLVMTLVLLGVYFAGSRHRPLVERQWTA